MYLVNVLNTKVLRGTVAINSSSKRAETQVSVELTYQSRKHLQFIGGNTSIPPLPPQREGFLNKASVPLYLENRRGGSLEV